MLVSVHFLVATLRIGEWVGYFADYCYASTWLNRPHSLLHSLNIFSFSLSAKMLVVNPLWMKAALDQDWHFYIFAFGVLPSFLTFDTYTWFFCLTVSMSICCSGIMPSVHKLVRLLTMIWLVIILGNSLSNTELLPLKYTLKDWYFMIHYNRLHLSALLCHRPAEERWKDVGFLGTVTVKEKYPLLGKEVLQFTWKLYFSIIGEELLQTSFVINMQTNCSYHLHLHFSLHHKGNFQRKAATGFRDFDIWSSNLSATTKSIWASNDFFLCVW